MHALELRDNSLQWETERQNRVHQDALEQKKRQMRLEAARREPVAAEPAAPAAALPLDEWIDKLQRIPDMRSALIPFDEEEEAGWSKPFSLAKADIEPWLSFYKGYRQSRLFLDTAREEAGRAGSLYSLDYPIQALLELRRVDVRLILEPPVQINGQVEYLDIEGEISNSRDPSHVRALLRSAVVTHDRLLDTAKERGRTMGDALHDALLGDGHANLIKAWEKARGRKPTVEDLHRMLTTGRTQPPPEKKTVPADAMPHMPEQVIKAAPVRPAQPARVAPAAPPVAPQKLRAPQINTAAIDDDDDDDEEAIVTLGAKKPAQPNRSRRLVWTLVHASLGCAALAAYIFLL